MLDTTKNQFSHVKAGDTPWRSDGLRDFFLYRDLRVEAATGGRVLAQLVNANNAPAKGTGWHRHGADFHIVIMTKGCARFMYEDRETLAEAGDCVHQRPGIAHYLFDYSSEIEYIEIVSPADFTSVDAEPAAGVRPHRVGRHTPRSARSAALQIGPIRSPCRVRRFLRARTSRLRSIPASPASP